MHATTCVERFGVRHEESLVVTVSDGRPVHVAVCRLVMDGTLSEIFARLGSPELVSLPNDVVEAFKKQHYGVLQDEDHATLFLCEGLVIDLEHDDDRGGFDRTEFSLHGTGIWRAEHGHQIVAPAHLFS